MDIGERILSNQPFPTLMGVKILSAEKDMVRAQIVVRPDLCTAGNIMHGGAIMAFADALGAIGADYNLGADKLRLGAQNLHAHQGREGLIGQNALADVHDTPFFAIIHAHILAR